MSTKLTEGTQGILSIQTGNTYPHHREIPTRETTLYYVGEVLEQVMEIWGVGSPAPQPTPSSKGRVAAWGGSPTYGQ